MKKTSFLSKIFCAFLVMLFLQTSCTTEDILPTIKLSVNKDNLSEANGTVVLTATVNLATNKLVTVPIITSGTATASSDYSLSAAAITINTGETSGNIVITGVQDQEIEGTETLIINLGEVSNYLVLKGSSIELTILDDDADSDNDGVLDSDDKCPNTAGEIANDGCPYLGFLINEVFYDPAPGNEGDANGDGTRSPLDDEFIEFFNSGQELDLSGYTISDDDEVRHVFPANSIIEVNQVLLVFGGGTPTGTFDGAVVQTASKGMLNMSNSGDVMTLKDAAGNVVLTFDIEPLSNNPDESYTRNPDLTGEFEQHSRIAEANGKLFSPGTKLDGSSFK